jgi:hypothetical protein
VSANEGEDPEHTEPRPLVEKGAPPPDNKPNPLGRTGEPPISNDNGKAWPLIPFPDDGYSS